MWPVEGRSKLRDHLSGLIAEFFRVLQEYLHRLDRHWTVSEDRNARNLSGLHQFLQEEQKFLCSFDRECRHDDAASALNGLRDEASQFGTRIGRWVDAVAIGRFHHEDVRRFAFG